MLNRTGFVLLICSSLSLIAIKGLSQSFTFADVHPVNNPDSLEQWLNANPKAPALVRIKNLIMLERTHNWLKIGEMGRRLPTLHALAVQTHDPTALAAYDFLKAKNEYRSNNLYGATLYGSRALTQFEKHRDISGQINAHCLLFSIGYGQNGYPSAADTNLTQAHWQQSQQLLAAHPNPHDQIAINSMALHQINVQSDLARQQQFLLGVLNYIMATPACAYARRNFQMRRGGLYYQAGNYQASYAHAKRILIKYPTTDAYELATIYFNLGNDCTQLDRLNEGLSYYQKATKLALVCSPVRYEILVPAYEMASNLAVNKGLFEKAYRYLVQARTYEQQANEQANNRRMQELQARYESSRRQRQIDLLQKKQEIDQYQRNLYIKLLGLSGLGLITISLLAWRLYRNRQKLQQKNLELEEALAEVQQLNTTLEHFIGIIAHDMRKPLISFRNLAELIGDRLQKRAYGDIQLISRAIDQSGNQIETMLDNLLRWALAQREAIPYRPESLLLISLLNRVTDLYRNLVQFQHIQITVDCPETLYVWADDNGLQLIVRNLLDNALKHLGAVGEVRVTAIVTADQQVQIQIDDSGEGIAPNQLAFLQDFFAGHVEGHVGQKGLGLGLLLVRDFAARNNGHVEVTSQPGQHTFFSVYVPLSVEQPAVVQTEGELQL